MLSIVVAKSDNNIIGKDNQLVWHIPEDLKHFRQLTLDKVLIMGRKTFDAVGSILNGKKIVVFTNNPNFVTEQENVEIVHSVDEINEYVNSDEECMVVGGSMIYHLLMPKVNKIYMTEIHKDYEGDAFFPKMSEEDWKVIRTQKGLECESIGIDYDFVEYERV